MKCYIKNQHKIYYAARDMRQRKFIALGSKGTSYKTVSLE